MKVIFVGGVAGGANAAAVMGRCDQKVVAIGQNVLGQGTERGESRDDAVDFPQGLAGELVERLRAIAGRFRQPALNQIPVTIDGEIEHEP